MLGGCSYCDELEALDPWQAIVIRRAMAATPESPPDCTVTGASRLASESGAPGANADPNLLEVARLEIERDCYKEAEEETRRRLEKLQDKSRP